MYFAYMKSPEVLQILDRLEQLQRSYLREFSYRVGLNLRQLEALIYLSKCNRYSRTPVALSEYLGLTKGTVSQTVLSLETKRLLTKTADSKDARLVHLLLTRKGERLLEQCAEEAPLEKALSQNADMTETLGRQLRTLLAEVQRANHSKTFGACYSCAYFRRHGLGSTHQCGLTGEPLLDHESLKICREHTMDEEKTSPLAD